MHKKNDRITLLDKDAETRGTRLEEATPRSAHESLDAEPGN